MGGIYLLLGSNIGDKRQHLSKAQKCIAEQLGDIINYSSIYLSESWGLTDQPDFVNQILEIEFTNTPEILLRQLLSIEKSMGRERAEKWTSRIIDIDILYFKDLILSGDNLQIPHPQIAERRFTLEPLTEIAPDFIHPVLGKTNAELLEVCSDPLKVQRMGNEASTR